MPDGAAVNRGTAASTINRLLVMTKSHEEDNNEFAHQFEVHSYRAPTNCTLCSGLLVGLWSQGLQCKMCRMNIHRGQGLGEHDDCRAEALMTPCSRMSGSTLR